MPDTGNCRRLQRTGTLLSDIRIEMNAIRKKHKKTIYYERWFKMIAKKVWKIVAVLVIILSCFAIKGCEEHEHPSEHPKSDTEHPAEHPKGSDEHPTEHPG